MLAREAGEQTGIPVLFVAPRQPHQGLLRAGLAMDGSGLELKRRQI
jgi:hypothetical protein